MSILETRLRIYEKALQWIQEHDGSVFNHERYIDGILTHFDTNFQDWEDLEGDTVYSEPTLWQEPEAIIGTTGLVRYADGSMEWAYAPIDVQDLQRVKPIAAVIPIGTLTAAFDRAFV